MPLISQFTISKSSNLLEEVHSAAWKLYPLHSLVQLPSALVCSQFFLKDGGSLLQKINL